MDIKNLKEIKREELYDYGEVIFYTLQLDNGSEIRIDKTETDCYGEVFVYDKNIASKYYDFIKENLNGLYEEESKDENSFSFTTYTDHEHFEKMFEKIIETIILLQKGGDE